MGGLTNMLLGQAARPQGVPGVSDSTLSGLSPETQAALRELASQGQMAPMPVPSPTPVPTPVPAPAPAQSGGILDMIKRWFLPSTQSLAQGAPRAAQPTPEQLAARNRALAGGQ
jgi:hypothetical protein